MRKCLRCETEMEADFGLSGGFGNTIRTKGLGTTAVSPTAAVRPHGGEASISIDGRHLGKPLGE